MTNGARKLCSSPDMKKKKKESSDEVSTARENYKSELDAPLWSVVTFEKVAAKGLTYLQAAEKMGKLKAEKVSGLCIITDEASARLKPKKSNK